MNTNSNTHPSHGLISINRSICGGRGLHTFGSDVRHRNIITLEIHHAVNCREYMESQFVPEGAPVVRVMMSSEQFASMMTTMNVGSGTPCTISMIEGEYIESEVVKETVVERNHREYEERMKNLSKEVSSRISDVLGILDTSKISKKDAQEIKRNLEYINTNFASNARFAVEQFESEMTRTVNSAKAEIDSFVTSVVQRAGIEQLTMSPNDVLSLGNDE